jgi:outer membrane protein OmpA-like peptidoglycan-associated protein
MKKTLIITLPLIALMPGCLLKKNTPVKKNIYTTTSHNISSQQPPIHETDIEIEEFILQDELDENIFDSKKPSASWDNTIETTVIQEQGNSIYFDYDSIKINPSEEDKLRKNARMISKSLRKDKKAVALIEGHSCKIAVNPDYNHVLSYERAQTVADLYVEEGVQRERIRVIGRGCTQLITEQEGMEAQAPNRRVETHIATTLE